MSGGGPTSPPGASPAQPRSYRFRREREAQWSELEALIDQAETRGLDSLDAYELHHLPALYRGALSSLSIARSISLDRGLVQYLESLSARGYLMIYSAKLGFWRIVWAFLATRLNRAIYDARLSLAASSAALLIGTVCGFLLVQDDGMRFYAYVDAGLAAGRGPAAACEELREVLYTSGSLDELSSLAAYLFTHNTRIGMACFALGFAAGIPVLLLLFTNGLMIGAFWSIYADCGQAMSFWAWSMGHGVSELLAVCLCGAAGLEIGRAVLLPGRRTRRVAAAEAGRRGALIVLGAVILFLIAGLLEGFFRQLVLGEVWRGLMAASTALLWGAYIARGWRVPGARSAGGRADG